MMSLSALPDDILLEITKWVATDDYIPRYETVHYPYIPFSARRRTKFLGSLALCSRRLNQIASPILYKTFVQTRERALPAFLRLLCSRPERGAYVTKFVVSAYNAAEERFYRRDILDFPRLDLVTFGVELELLDYFQLKRPGWITNLEDGDWKAVVALLLLLLPALKEVDIVPYNRTSNLGYIDTALEYAALQQRSSRAQHSLKNLTNVSMAYWDTGIGTGMGKSFDALLPFCALSSVRKAQIHRCSENFFFPPSKRYPNIQDLQISNSNFGSEAISNILQCFPSLKNLYYEHGGVSFGCPNLLPEYLGEASSHLHETLEELTVLGENSFGWAEKRAIGSLTRFKKLKKIVTNYDILLKTDPERDGEQPKLINILPSSLEILAIGQCTLDILLQVRDLLDQKPSSTLSFPKPNKIVIGLVSPDYSADPAKQLSAEQLQAMKEEGKELIADAKAMEVDICFFHPNFRMGGNDLDHDKYPFWR